MRLLMVLALLTVSVSQSSATTYQVPDPENGIVTIGDALERAVEGDVVEIAAGEYSESLTITTNTLTLRGTGGNVLIHGRRAAASPAPVTSQPALTIIGSSGIVLEDLTLLGGSGLSDLAADPTEAGSPGIVADSSTLAIRRCTIDAGLAGRGGGLVLTGSSAVLTGCVVRGPAGYNTHILEHPPKAPGPGYPGIVVRDESDLLTEDTVVVGGRGGMVSIFPWEGAAPGSADGAAGVLVESSSSATFRSSGLFGGNSGLGSPAPGVSAIQNSLATLDASCARGGTRTNPFSTAPRVQSDETSAIEEIHTAAQLRGHLLGLGDSSGAAADATGDGAVDAADVARLEQCQPWHGVTW